MNLSKLFKYAIIIIATVILITFILPYNPEEIYNNQTVVQTEQSSQLDHQERNNIHSDSHSDREAHHEAHGDPRSSKKMYVILVTGFRTGSTFLGELFNQNADVLYLFEPFHQNHIKALVRDNAIHGATEENTLLEQRTAYLDQMINNCQVEWPMFGGMSLGMKCGSAEENMKRYGTPECDKADKRWDKQCTRRDIVALKLIRLQRIQHLELVPGIKDANVYVIHLIRDPRGTMNSRLGFGTFYLDDIENLKVKPLTPEKMGIAAANLCDREWDNIQYTEKLPDWLQGRFLRVTHDEMSLEPIKIAERVYEFLGKKIPDDMSDFLISHTTVKEKGVLNTSRNSTEVLEKWKNNLKPDIVRAIEDKCKNVMDFMGYSPHQP